MMRCCGVSPIIWSSICPPMGRARKVWRWVFAVSTSGGWGFAERWVPSSLISPDATRPPGRKPRRPVIVATRCCGAAHGGPSLALTGCACLAGANDVRSPVAVCRTTIQPDDRKLARSIMRIKTASLSKLSVAIRQARCPSMVIHLAGKSSLGERYGTACQRNPAY